MVGFDWPGEVRGRTDCAASAGDAFEFPESAEQQRLKLNKLADGKDGLCGWAGSGASTGAGPAESEWGGNGGGGGGGPLQGERAAQQADAADGAEHRTGAADHRHPQVRHR